MGLVENAEKYLISIGLKRGFAAGVGAIVGFFGTSTFIHAVSILKTVGVTVIVDLAVFQKEMLALGPIIGVMAHDWLKVRFPNNKWL